MRGTSEELGALRSLLDASLSRATDHLCSIVAERTVAAAQLTQVLTGMTGYAPDVAKLL
jgi:hypothetical protein